MNMGKGSSLIPHELIRPFLRDYLVTHELKDLAFRAGIHRATIEKILYNEGRIQFDTADRLVCALGYGGSFWNSQEISEIYKKINLRYIDRTRPITKKKSREYATTAVTDRLLPAN